MRSRYLVAGICVAVALLGFPQVGYAEVFKGKIKEEQVIKFDLTTDTSLIVEILLITQRDNVDVDIVVTVPDGDDEDEEPDIVATSESGIDQIEKLTLGLLGATEYTICITNVDGPTSKFIITFETMGDTGAERGRMAHGDGPRMAGSFDLNGPVSAEDAGLQRLIRERLAGKLGG